MEEKRTYILEREKERDKWFKYNAIPELRIHREK